MPAELRPGGVFLCEVRLAVDRPTRIAGCEVVLVGREDWRSGGSVTLRQEVLRLGATVFRDRELPAGETAGRVRFRLPASAPPSYRGANGRIEYELQVEVSLPWWVPRRAAYPVHIDPPKLESPTLEPVRFASRAEGPLGTEPHVELSLSSGWTRVGDDVHGAFALSNTNHHRYSEVRVSLRSEESLYEGDDVQATERGVAYGVTVSAEDASEEETIPFSFRLPEDVAPDLPRARRQDGDPALIAMAWVLRLEVAIRWGKDLVLEVPFRVLPRSPRPGDAPSLAPPPTVGSDRLRGLWQKVGREHGLRYDGEGLRGSVGKTGLVLRRERRKDGLVVVAELTFPSLGLDLTVEPASSVRRWLGGGVRVGDPSWDREHFVRARDADQGAQLLQRVLPRLQGATLQGMSDERLGLEVADPGATTQRVRELTAAAVGLARLIEEARADLPPPTALAHALGAWRALADGLGATLETGRMGLTVELVAGPAEIRVAFDREGAPFATWFSVEPRSPIDPSYQLSWTRGDAATGWDLERYPAELRSALGEAAEDLDHLRVEPVRVSGRIDVALGAAGAPRGGARREVDPGVGRRVLDRLAHLTMMLRGASGPYR